MDTLLKQRLVGAIVLVALAVIFIPMLLEGPGPTLVPDMEDLPEPERLERELSLEPLPLPESGPGADSGAAERMLTQSGPSGSDGVSETESAAQAALPAHKPAQNVEDAAQADTPAPEAMPGSARPAPAKVAPAPEKTVLPARPVGLERFVVQVVSLSRKDRALALRDQLREAGFATQVVQAKVKGNILYRVRVGPFLERSDAERVRTQLEKRFGHKGRVLTD